MKLADLNPVFFDAGGSGISDEKGNPVPHRKGVGIWFDCPCGKEGCVIAVSFTNPLDGQPPRDASGPLWDRAGDSFDNLTLTPSILKDVSKGGCGWHGFLTNGELKSC